MGIQLKRTYDKPAPSDGFRVLVDRLWPRGIKKDDLQLDLWLKEIAPSDGLRQWFAHDPDKFEEFKRRYFEELESKQELVEQLHSLIAKHNTVTLTYAAKNRQYNNAVALKVYLQEKFS